MLLTALKEFLQNSVVIDAWILLVICTDKLLSL